MSTLPPSQKEKLRQLILAAQEERLHHCYLFEGPAGVGKRAAAIQVAQAAACTAEAPERPCGTCRQCRTMEKGTNFDLVDVGTDPQRKTPIISVRQAAEIVEQARMQRYSARRRTFLLDPADCLHPQAANALLKTLEEPPAGTGFILVTSRVSLLLPTILSRCQRVRFGALETGAIQAWLEEQEVAEAPRIARLSQGRPAHAQSLAEGGLQVLDEARESLLAVLSAGPSTLFEYSASVAGRSGESREDWEPRLDRLFFLVESLLGDAVAWANGRHDDLLHGDRPELVAAISVALWPGGVERLHRALETARDNHAANVNTKLLVESLVSRVATELGPARLVSSA